MKTPDHIKTAAQYLDALPPERVDDMRAMDAFIRKTVPKLAPTFVGGFMGYGPHHFVYESGRELDWFVIGLANQKAHMAVYVCAGDGGEYIAEKAKASLGKVSVGKSCIRFKKLSDVNLDGLADVLKKAEAAVKAGAFCL